MIDRYDLMCMLQESTTQQLRDEIEYLRKQLAEKDAEIARLRKEQEQYGPDKVAIQKQAWVEADRQRQINELRQQLAASQTKKRQLREAIGICMKEIESWYDEVGYDRFNHPEVNKALALPQDTSALEAVVQRAGEVMRERVMRARGNGQLYPVEIHALPGVTLEDLR